MDILIVDDEDVSRMKMETIMERFGRCNTIDTGEKAIELYKKAWAEGNPYDVITLDIDMPGMDGEQVLFEMRNLEKELGTARDNLSIIMMVTCMADKNRILGCLEAGCSDYIIKPFTPDTIAGKLKRFGINNEGEIQAPEVPETAQQVDPATLFADISKKIKRGDIRLPPFPSIITEYRRLKDEGADIDTISDLIRQDMAIASKLLSTSNSAYYRGVSENNTIEGALNRLGSDNVDEIINLLCSRSLYLSENKGIRPLLEELWKHALISAHACEIIAEESRLESPKPLFNMGLLHDIGALFLIQIIGELDRKGKYESGIDKASLMETVRQYHGRFGATILKKWGFDQHLCDAARFHNDLEDAENYAPSLAMVHLANSLVKTMGFAPLGRNGEGVLHELPSANMLKMDESGITALKEKLEVRMVQLNTVLH